MSLCKELQLKLQADYLKAPKKYYNQNNLEMTWSDTEKLYIGIDKGVTWIASIQNTTVPIFSVRCKNCSAPNYFAICDDMTKKCRKCNKLFTAKLNVSKTSRAFEIFEKLKKEM